MATYDYVIVDVFTTTALQGNPLAVFANAAGLSDALMQQIARELNLSESVFLFAPTKAGSAARARIFTPRRELDFAGHPTVGSAYVLAARNELGDAFTIEENVGSVPIETETDDRGNRVFWLTTPAIEFFETLDRAFAASLLGLSEADLAADVPPQFASAGSPFLFVALDSPEAVDRAELQSAHLKGAIGTVNSVGTFVFARKNPQSASSFDVYARMFAPQTGIAEDPATGSATGPLTAYMMKYGMLPAQGAVRFVSEQGAKMGRRSLLQVRVGDGENAAIKIGGSAVTIAEGRFFLER